MSTWQLIQAAWNEFGSYEWILAGIPALIFLAIAIGVKVAGKQGIFDIRILLLLISFPLSIISFVVQSDTSTFFFLNNAARQIFQSGITLSHRDYCHPIGETSAATRQAINTRLHSADLLWLTSSSSHELKPLAKDATVPCDLTPIVSPDYRIIGKESEATYMMISRAAGFAFMLAQGLLIFMSAMLAVSYLVARRQRPIVAAPLVYLDD